MAQFPSHRISQSDNIRTGNAVSADRTVKGAPLNDDTAQAVLVVDLGTPVVADPDGLVTGYSGAAGTIPMDGALAATVDANGNVVLDVPRCLVVDSGGADTAVITITGKDVYGVTIVENITLNGTTAVNGVKAFKKITSIVAGATVSNGAFIGTTGTLGLPYAPVIGGFLGGILNENTADAGTYVAPSRVTATATTTDVRGTYLPAGALDGTNRYKVRMAVKNGPNDTDLFGVTQYGG